MLHSTCIVRMRSVSNQYPQNTAREVQRGSIIVLYSRSAAGSIIVRNICSRMSLAHWLGRKTSSVHYILIDNYRCVMQCTLRRMYSLSNQYPVLPTEYSTRRAAGNCMYYILEVQRGSIIAYVISAPECRLLIGLVVKRLPSIIY